MPTNNRQRYCPDCSPLVKKEWAQQNPDKMREYRSKWKESNPDCDKDYYEKNKERILSLNADWREKHPEQMKAYDKKWRVANAARLVAVNRKWQIENPDEWWKIHKKANAKHRTLGFVPLNEPFDGAEGHHLDDKHVVWIPKELHRSIWHNQSTGQGMEEINRLTFEWLNINTATAGTSC